MATTKTWNEARARAVIDDHRALEGPLLPILHGLQAEFGYVPEQAERLLADELNLTRAEVHGVVSFYHDFRARPAGRHVLKLCRAEACQSMGAEANAAKLLTRLGMGWGDTTPDGRLTIEAVYCLGLCATAPGVLLDGQPIGRVDAARLESLAEEAA
ncbi:MAG: formate dehydrogenase subunit gamma [Rhodospirillales bacterium 20-60-12]|nr:MAG: formate dehydrogenase subunit gamma [Rhodospirillales bacterium 20-60-12]HQT67130.1 formate dehydrogenase subunit gamma [Acetobacteraceae bacterium]HQU01132.1 formate dehydrogenase subunit gamma [Acetobacteraceae bacterium]